MTLAAPTHSHNRLYKHSHPVIIVHWSKSTHASGVLYSEAYTLTSRKFLVPGGSTWCGTQKAHVLPVVCETKTRGSTLLELERMPFLRGQEHACIPALWSPGLRLKYDPSRTQGQSLTRQRSTRLLRGCVLLAALLLPQYDRVFTKESAYSERRRQSISLDRLQRARHNQGVVKNVVNKRGLRNNLSTLQRPPLPLTPYG